MNRGSSNRGPWRSGVLYPGALLAAFAAVFILLGISPISRQDWLLENVLVVAAIASLMATCGRMRFSNTAYSLLFALLVLHEVGAHYTYSLVPYESWLAKVTGMTLSAQFGLQRDHYDRMIHFAYGLLVFVPATELLRSVAPPRGIWRYLSPVLFILSNSAIYELFEWAAAAVFGGELGVAYVGAQGDEWDAQKDMALAAAGAIAAILLLRVRHALRHPGRVRREFNEAESEGRLAQWHERTEAMDRYPSVFRLPK